MSGDNTAELFSRIGNVLLILMFGSTYLVLASPLIGPMFAWLLARDREQLRDAVEQANRDFGSRER